MYRYLPERYIKIEFCDEPRTRLLLEHPDVNILDLRLVGINHSPKLDDRKLMIREIDLEKWFE